MSRATEPFAEQIQYMKALLKEFGKRNDVDAISALDQELNVITHRCSSTEEGVRKIIKELSCEVHELEAAAAYPHREGLHAERMAVLQRQIDVAKQAIEEMDTQARDAEEQYTEVEAQLQRATAAARDESSKSNAIANHLQHQLGMYKHITGATWAKPVKSTISGTISNLKTRKFEVFDFDRNMDKFELINALWKLI